MHIVRQRSAAVTGEFTQFDPGTRFTAWGALSHVGPEKEALKRESTKGRHMVPLSYVYSSQVRMK